MSSNLSICIPLHGAEENGLSESERAFPVNVLEVEFNNNDKEDMFSFIQRVSKNSFRDPRSSAKARELYTKVLGNANEYKQGDETIGVAAPNERCRTIARKLISNTRIGDLDSFPLNADHLLDLCQEVNSAAREQINSWTIGELREFILNDQVDESEIHKIMPGLTSDVVACVIKLMSNEDLVKLGSKIFNPLPGSRLGAKGYFGARVQPNSPTDDPEDIFWQCLNAFSFAVGDVMLGTNPVSSDPESVYAVEKILKHVVEVFKIDNILPFCVLAHIDVQALVEKKHPGSTSLWFQSIAGSDTANQTFDLPVQKMLDHALTRSGKFGLYLETGQGADFTNGHSKGMDMIMHDARKYGFARALRERVAQAQERAGRDRAARIYINDVAGFIGPEVFRSKEQLVRVCLEDIAMGKLHGLTIGLDVCATLHMDISLDDLDWALDRILPANPSWAMALPTKNDPMLSYLTTAFQDHVRLREKFGYKVDDAMWEFFANKLEVVNLATGKPTEHFGNPAWVFLKFQRMKGDARSDEAILHEAHTRIAPVQARGVPIAIGHGAKSYDLNPELDTRIRHLYNDAKVTLWHEYSDEFLSTIPNAMFLRTQSKNREDYVFHPETGELLSLESTTKLDQERLKMMAMEDDETKPNLVVVISDGLCADAIMDQGHLAPFLSQFRQTVETEMRHQFVLKKENLVVKSGRVSFCYSINGSAETQN